MSILECNLINYNLFHKDYILILIKALNKQITFELSFMTNYYYNL